MSMPLIFIQSHPTQYHAPLYRYLASAGLPLEVWYGSLRGAVAAYDPAFSRQVQWDLPLLEGYRFRVFENRSISGLQKGYFSQHHPGMEQALRQEAPAWVVVPGWNYRTYVHILRKASAWGHRLALRAEAHYGIEQQRPAWRRYLKKRVLQKLLQPVEAFLYLGQQSLRYYHWLGVPPEKCFFTPYGVENQRFGQNDGGRVRQHLLQTTGWPDDAWVILMSGKYILKKRPFDLIEAFARLQNPKARLVLLGEGPLRPAMEQRIVSLKLQHKVFLTGFVNQQAMPGWYHAAQVLVMCSGMGETWGLSVNEGMNAGLPVIVSHACGCAPDLVDGGQNGWVFPTGDVTALASHLEQLAGMPPSQQQVMGRHSLDRVAQYGYEQVAHTLKRLC